MENDGTHWKSSVGRKERERNEREEKHERLMRAKKKRTDLEEKIQCKEIQTKITDSLPQIPENRRRLLKQEEEKDNRMIM